MQEIEHFIQSSLIQSRRRWLTTAAAALASWSPLYGFADKDFWNTKNPADWSSDEIKRLVTRSPWAKQVSVVKITTTKKAASTSKSKKGAPTAPQLPSSETEVTYRGTVVWESAAPIRASVNTALPEGFAGMYVLTVVSIPLVSGRASRADLDGLCSHLTLTTKGHDPLAAGTVQQLKENDLVFLFGFPRKALEISKDDKDVWLESRVKGRRFVVTFNPREMIYRGDLAV